MQGQGSGSGLDGSFGGSREEGSCHHFEEPNPLFERKGPHYSQQDFVYTIAKQPPAVLMASGLSNAMLLCSFILMLDSAFEALPECTSSSDSCEWLAVDIFLRFDARALQNIGHVGLLLIFMTMYWQGGKIYCFYAVKLSFLLMSVAAAGSTIVAAFSGSSSSKAGRVLISLCFFLPSVLGLLSVSFGSRGFRRQPSMSFFGGRREYLFRYYERLRPGESDTDTPQNLSLARKLHCCLLVMTALMILEMAYSVLLVLFDTMIPAPTTFAAHVDALMKAYTTMFHYTFVLGTGFAAITRLDDNCDMFLHGGGVFFIFDAFSVICSFAGCAAGTEDMAAFGICIARESRLLPLRVAAKALALYYALLLRPHTLKSSDRIPYAKGPKYYRTPRLTLSNMHSYGYLEEPKPSKQQQKRREKKGRKIRENRGNSTIYDEVQVQVGVSHSSYEEGGLGEGDPVDTEDDKNDIQDAYYDAKKRRWRIAGSMLGSAVFGLVWCFETVLMLYTQTNIPLKYAQGSLIPESPTEFFEALSAAENFGLHGAAFLAFQISVSYSSEFAAPMFRGIHCGSGMIICLASVIQASLLPSSSARIITSFFVLRSIVSLVFAIGFFFLSSKTIRSHFKLAKHAPLPELLNKRRNRRMCCGVWSSFKHMPLSDEDDDDDSRELEDITAITTSTEKLVPDAKSPRKMSDSSLSAENLLLLDNEREEEHKKPAKSRNAVAGNSYKGLGQGIEDHEEWMKKVIIGLTVTFLVKAMLQDLATTGYTSDKVFGAGAFPGIMVRQPGYDIAFHVPYLATLFLWHGVSSGNLVALDISRCLCISLVISSVSRIALYLYMWIGLGAMLVYWRAIVGVSEIVCLFTSVLAAQGATRCVKQMQFCSSDPLRTWRR